MVMAALLTLQQEVYKAMLRMQQLGFPEQSCEACLGVQAMQGSGGAGGAHAERHASLSPS